MSKNDTKELKQGVVLSKFWKPSYRFVDYKGRNMTIKMVDPENGFKPGEVMMTVNGPMAVSHARTIKIDKDGYTASTEAEENALMKLANRETNGSKSGSFLVTWENREMPTDQRKAELVAHQYKKQIDELQDQVAGKEVLERENVEQANLIENLKRQLANNKGG